MPEFVIPNASATDVREIGWTDAARAASLAVRRANAKGSTTAAARQATNVSTAQTFVVPKGVLTLAQSPTLAKDAIRKALPQAAIDKIQNRLDQGAQVLPEFRNLMRGIGEKFGIPEAGGAEFEAASRPRMVAVGPLKGLDRTAEKAVLDYTDKNGRADLGLVKDIVRGTIVVDTLHEARAVLAEIRSRATGIVKDEDRFEKPLATGYRDANIVVRLSNGLPAEIQVHLHPLLKAKNNGGWDMYQKWRSSKPGSAGHHALLTGMQSLYGQAAAIAGIVGAGALRGLH